MAQSAPPETLSWLAPDADISHDGPVVSHLASESCSRAACQATDGMQTGQQRGKSVLNWLWQPCNMYSILKEAKQHPCSVMHLRRIAHAGPMAFTCRARSCLAAPIPGRRTMVRCSCVHQRPVPVCQGPQDALRQWPARTGHTAQHMQDSVLASLVYCRPTTCMLARCHLPERLLCC